MHRRIPRAVRRTTFIVSATVLALALAVVSAHPLQGAPMTEVQGVVTGVDGAIVSLLGGAIRIDAGGAQILRRGSTTVIGISGIVPGVEIDALVMPAQADGILPAVEIRVGRTESAEIRGTVTALAADGTGLTVDGVVLGVDSSTRFSGETARGPVQGIADLAVGDFVDVDALPKGTGGALVASSVHADSEPKLGEGNDVEFKGVVESMSTGSWTIGGQVVAVTASTKIVGNPIVGDTVEVSASRDASGNLTALRIVVDGEDGGEGQGQGTQFTGAVQSIGTSSWMIGGRTVAVTSATVISGSPKVGDTVKVEATADASGNLTATRITAVSAQPPSGDEMEFSGVVTLMSATSWTIGGRAVAVTSGTEIDDSPTIGDTVRVEAIADSSGKLTATRIRLEQRSGSGGDGDGGGSGGDGGDGGRGGHRD